MKGGGRDGGMRVRCSPAMAMDMQTWQSPENDNILSWLRRIVYHSKRQNSNQCADNPMMTVAAEANDLPYYLSKAPTPSHLPNYPISSQHPISQHR